MSITSSNNLSVNNSLTVNGNCIFGVDNTSTIICNLKPTFNSDVTVSGNINQTSGTFSTSSGNLNLNGDVVINRNKKITTGTGDTTINGLLKCNGTINNLGLLASSGSFELGSTTGTNFTYIDIKTTGGNSDFDSRIGVTGGSSSNSGQGTLSLYSASCAINCPLTVYGITNNNNLTQTGTVACNAIYCTSINSSGTLNTSSLNNSGNLTVSGTSTVEALNASSINNSVSYNAVSCISLTDSGNLTVSGTSSLGTLSTSSINNTGALSTSNLEISASSLSYIDMKTVGNNSDYDVRISFSGGSSSTAGVRNLNITAGNTIINSPLSANSGTFSGITNNTNTSTNNGQFFKKKIQYFNYSRK